MEEISENESKEKVIKKGPLKTENYNFSGNFDRAVSLLSIKGYFLKGFLDDAEKPRERYEIQRRVGGDLKNSVGYISRKSLVKFVFEEPSSYAKDRKLIKKVLRLKTIVNSCNNSEDKNCN